MKREGRQYPVLFFHPPLKCGFGWDRHLHLALCYLACMGMHGHLEGFDCNWGFGDEESNLTMVFLQKKAYAARKIRWRTRKENYQLALALEFEALVMQIY